MGSKSGARLALSGRVWPGAFADCAIDRRRVWRDLVTGAPTTPAYLLEERRKDTSASADGDARLERIARRAVALIDGPRSRTTTWRVRVRGEDDARQVTRAMAVALRGAGHAVVRPGVVDPSRVPVPLLHRHLVLIVADARDRAAVRGWLRAAARASPRAHGVIALEPPNRRRGRVGLRAWAEDRRDALRAAAWLRSGRFAEAEAWIAVATATAAVERRDVAPEVRALHARLRAEAEHDRLEEEARSGLRRTTMPLVHALPLLLQIFNDSEDERTSLAAACGWARQHCLADAVLFLAEDDGRVLASEGWKSESLTEEERRTIVEAAVLTCLERPDGVLMAAPIRYGGARIGAAVVVGPRERRETMSEAALALAAASGSAVRGRLTTVAISRTGDGLSTDILGRSPAMASVRAAVARAAVTPFPVLIEGESGTGKELVARALHRLSARRDRRLATLNCAALSDDLAEAELFGHTRGAFTGAVASRPGLFEDAHGGTLFLDEVGELSPRAQAKLLRALQEREIRRVGENIPRQVDVRLMAATNRPLADMVATGGFREDLLFRLAVVRLRLPALRERAEDVPLLAHVFWRRFTGEAGKRAVLGADAVARLVCHPWPGNVRELQNVIAGMVVMAPARGRVAARHVDIVLAESGARAIEPPTSLEWARRQCERRTIAAALARHGGRRAAAARELGLTRQGLAKAVRRLRLTAGRDSMEGVA